MTQDEAEAFLQQYRAALKTWSMVEAGFAEGDRETLHGIVLNGRPILNEIANGFPELSYSAEMLKGSMDKTTERLLVNRPVRPPGRHTR